MTEQLDLANITDQVSQVLSESTGKLLERPEDEAAWEAAPGHSNQANGHLNHHISICP